MRTFLKDELERFLVAIDQALGQPVEVIVIGGTAAALHYGVTRATHDIDTWTTVKGDLAAAAETARLATGLHAHSPLDLDTLAGRFQDEMTPIGDPARIRGNVLAVVERLFPDHVEDIARRLRKPRR